MSRLVLVHGAMCNASIWPKSFLAGLTAQGHTVEVFDLPGQGADQTPKESVTLQTYADRTVAQLKSRDEPAVLIGHSMGGVVITQAADDFVAQGGELNQVIYLTAFLPRNGQSLLALAGSPEGEGDSVQANLVVEGEPPMGTLPFAATPTAIFNTTRPEQLAKVKSTSMESQPLAPFADPVSITDDRDITRRYIFALEDRAIPLALQRKMASATAVVETAKLATDHMPMYSNPEALITVIDRFCKE